MTSRAITYTSAGLLISSLSFGLAHAQLDAQIDTTAQTLGNVATVAEPAKPSIFHTAQLNLKTALRAAETYNPRIMAAQQSLAIRETDVRLARSGRLPVVEANASYGYLYQDNEFTRSPTSSLSGTTSSVGIGLRQPLFRGNQTTNAIARAKSTASAAEVQIQAERQQIYLEVATAYFDVQRDLAILRLNLESLETLQEQLKANEKRYELKDTSLTDVARSKSAVATAHTRIATARASHAASRSVFFRLTGLPGENLAPASPVSDVPPSMEMVLTKALRNNASIASARLTLEAAEYAVKEAKGVRLPSVDFNSSLNRGRRPENFGPFSDDRVTTAASAAVSVSVPLYQADQEFGSIKRAKQVKRFREIELMQTIAGVRDNTRITWDRLVASKSALLSHEDAVEAAEIAAVGTRKIYRSGLISAIDLTETERILLGAKVDRERAKHDLNVTTYSLLSIIGEISPE